MARICLLVGAGEIASADQENVQQPVAVEIEQGCPAAERFEEREVVGLFAIAIDQIHPGVFGHVLKKRHGRQFGRFFLRNGGFLGTVGDVFQERCSHHPGRIQDQPGDHARPTSKPPPRRAIGILILISRALSLRQRNLFPGSLAVVAGELGDHDALVDGEVAEDLRCAAGRPVDLQQRHAVGLAQADVLFQRVGPETAAGGNVPVDRQRAVRPPSPP